MKDLPKVTFGIINCNRLHYLKSCVESLILCTDDYPNKEIIIVDNSSVEEGTNEYLSEKSSQGIIVHKTEKRDPNNEFAKALNFITEESTGDFIAPIQGDMQFVVRGGWLEEYVNFYSENINNIGCIMLDAQRTTRIKNQSKFSKKINNSFPFFYDFSRIPFCCSADVMYSRQSLEWMGRFLENNEGHEKGINSEDDMRKRIIATLDTIENPQVFCAMPQISPAVAIFTDSRGTNARVRYNKRYGDYWEAKEGYCYYKIRDYNKVMELFLSRNLPVGIEEAAISIGWDLPIDGLGNWKKSPIDPATATQDDYTVLYEDNLIPEDSTSTEKNLTGYIDEWMNNE
jgi:glycosyltransferase involved in cell wall biosynthesis